VAPKVCLFAFGTARYPAHGWVPDPKRANLARGEANFQGTRAQLTGRRCQLVLVSDSHQ
jgi:hypothetical protein